MASQRPVTKKELFKLYYFSLQNIVEKIFNIIKYQFQIFETFIELKIDIYVKIILAITKFHDFIQLYWNI